MRVAVIGTGYVGLVSGACLADVGHSVVCVDVDAAKVDRINAGETPLHEEGLQDILRRNIGTRLTAVTDLADAVDRADVTLICVGTPFDGRTIDLRFVLQAARSIGEVIAARRDYPVVAVKSTVVPGTTLGPVREALESASGGRAGVDFGLGVNPEFLAEGVAVRHFMEPDRIVAGGIDERSRRAIAELYRSFEGVPVIETNPTTAEMIKYASNALLATMISFSNEFAGYCESFEGVDVADVFAGVHRMRHLAYAGRDGERQLASLSGFLWPGCGFGGSCFPKDIKALLAQAEGREVPSDLLQSVLRINGRQPERLVAQLDARLPRLEDSTVAVLGLAFKPGTDDVRESPALRVVPALLARGARVVCHDPVAAPNARQALADAGVALERVQFAPRLEDAVEGCDALLLVTAWPEYARLPELLRERRLEPLLVDGRRFIPPDAYPRYAGVGLGPRTAGL